MSKIKLLFVIGFFALLTNSVEGQNANSKECPESALYPKLTCVEFSPKLDGAEIPIRVYAKGSQNLLDRTFVVVHNNERKGLNSVKEVLKENDVNGRLVEIVSNYKDGYKLDSGEIQAENRERYLYFGNGDYCVDPNRIYSEKGIREKLAEPCKQIPESKVTAIQEFGREVLKIVNPDNKYRFIIGVHNNTSDSLSVNNWSYSKDCDSRPEVSEVCGDAKTAVGVFLANKHETKKVDDTDDFILVSDISLFIKFFQFGKKFNMALQENKKYLDSHPETDDGSMSIYFGKKTRTVAGKAVPFLYMNIEAQGKDDINDSQKNKQKEAILSVIKMKL